MLFPMNVETPLGAFTECKVYVADGVVAVYTAPGDPVLTAMVGAIVMRPERGVRARLSTTDGDTWTIRKATGCGCGSALKRFDPRKRPVTV